MRVLLLVVLVAVAAMAWFSLAWSADADTKSVRERFESAPAAAPPAESQKAVVADIMDMYKDLYGEYPPTDVLVHYRDLAPKLTKDELRSRIKTDGGAPPGLDVPSQDAEKQVAAMAPPAPGDKPVLPASMKAPADAALPVRIMNIAMQLSALSEELQTAQRAGPAPKAFESFMSFK